MSQFNTAAMSNGDPMALASGDGAQVNGAVSPSNDDGIGVESVSSDLDTSGMDALRENKLKARETMAAAGALSDSPGNHTSANSTANGTANQSSTVSQLSRKRSRDGTRLPLTKPKPVVKELSKEKRAEHDEIMLERYIQRDLRHCATMNDHAESSRALVMNKEMEKEYLIHEVWSQRRANPGSVFGYGFMGYGNRYTDGKSQIVFSDSRGAPKGRRSRQMYVPRKDNSQQAEQHEELVPLRIDVELDKLRVRDTFTWNLHERLISPETFADFLIEDLKVPAEAAPEILRQVKQEMREQIDNYYPHIIVEEGSLEPSRPYNEHKDDELRIQIKLNITIGRVTLIDQFEWDINNPLNSPEEFARQMACENALSGEFMTAIAHSIREQSQLYTKSLYLTNHCFDGRPVEDPELRDAFLPSPVNSAFRPMQTQKDWMPYMYEMSEAEFERTETSMMREHRAQKRQLNRRGGPALPDLKDRLRTVRSLLVHSVVPGAVESFETTGIPKTRRGGRGGRRTGPRADEDGDSDELETDDESVPESPAPSLLATGTARTRGMRGAASAAQAALRANYGRSQTPDSQVAATPHESRTAPRRSMLREESVIADEDSLVVKLKLNKARFRAWVENVDKKKRASLFPLSGYASQPQTNTATTPSRSSGGAQGTPQPNGSQRASSVSHQQQTKYDAHGRADIDHWPLPDEIPAPPPPWLVTALDTLRESHPESSFEPIMKPYSINVTTGDPVRNHLEPGALPPASMKLQYFPRIRCNDCPGKLYNAVPGRVIEDFEVHLRNRSHREKVQARRNGGR